MDNRFIEIYTLNVIICSHRVFYQADRFLYKDQTTKLCVCCELNDDQSRVFSSVCLMNRVHPPRP